MDATISEPTLSGGGFTPPAPTPRSDSPQNFAWLRSAAILPTVIKNPIESFSANAYERPVFQTQMFHNPVTMVHDPALLRHLFVERADALASHAIRQKVLKPALREGMLTAEGDVWRRARRNIAPVFAPRNVHGFAASMRDVTERFVEKMKNGPDRVLLADEFTQDLAWQAGDVALIDNFTVMHGRRPFEGKRRVLASLIA